MLSNSKEELEFYAEKISIFLSTELKISLHPEKTKIVSMSDGVTFLGLRIFENHKILKECNIRKFKKKLARMCEQFNNHKIDYDEVYNLLEGWIAYSKNADTYRLRKKLLTPLEYQFAGEISTKEYNRHIKEENLLHQIDRPRKDQE
jgi:hypothetical protein